MRKESGGEGIGGGVGRCVTEMIGLPSAGLVVDEVEKNSCRRLTKARFDECKKGWG